MRTKLDQPAQYWDRRWKEKEIGWDIGYASTPIISYMLAYGHKQAAILIPGCGNAHEAAWLVEHGFTNITLLDISPTAIEQVSKRFANNNSINAVCADFFTYKGKFDLIIEQTFFCAIPITSRSDYTKKMADLLKEEGRLVGVLFDREFEYGGPPFGGHAATYRSLFADYFKVKHFESCYNSIPARAGSELFINLLKK